MKQVGWLVKWPTRERTLLIGRDEDPRTTAWTEPPTEVIDLFARIQPTPKPTPPKVPGRVKLLTEWEGIWEGSSFCNLRDLGDKWLCDWPSSGGTASNLEVPKNLCSPPAGE